MCLIIMQSKGEKLPANALENGWSHNSDGAGYMFAAAGELVLRKPFFKLKHLLRSYRKDHAAYGQTSPFVIHFRYATHGDCTTGNTHPHSLCGGKVGLAHNGILSDFEPPMRSEDSDTVHFCNTVLAYRCAEHVMDDKFRVILKNMIGAGNKFVLLDSTGQTSIVNEEAGLWDGCNWFSNKTYATKQVPRPQWNWGKAAAGSTVGLPSALPSHYAGQTNASLFTYGPNGANASASGRPDEFDKRYDLEWDREQEEAADELANLEQELDCFVAAEEKLSDEEREHLAAIGERMAELNMQLDARLR